MLNSISYLPKFPFHLRLLGQQKGRGAGQGQRSAGVPGWVCLVLSDPLPRTTPLRTSEVGQRLLRVPSRTRASLLEADSARKSVGLGSLSAIFPGGPHVFSFLLRKRPDFETRFRPPTKQNKTKQIWLSFREEAHVKDICMGSRARFLDVWRGCCPPQNRRVWKDLGGSMT